MADAYIVDAVRSPTGRRKGGLSDVHGADLGAHVLKALVDRNGIPDAEYDDVMFGCVDTIGPLAGDIARTAWLAAGLSDAVPGTTIDRQCGSSQQAVHFAAQAIMAGVNDVVVAGGVQTMTQIPISSAMIAAQPMGFSDPFLRESGLGCALRQHSAVAVCVCTNDCRQVGDFTRADGRVCTSLAYAGACRD